MTLTTTEELKHLASSDNANELTRRLARECLANREAQPVGYNQVQRDMMKDILVRKLGANLRGEKLGMDDIHAATMDLIMSGFRQHTAPPAPAVPEEMKRDPDADVFDPGFINGWNACRAAMLAAAPEGGSC